MRESSSTPRPAASRAVGDETRTPSSGRWTYPLTPAPTYRFQAPTRLRSAPVATAGPQPARAAVDNGHVTLWSPIADIVAHPEAYAELMSVLEAHDRQLADNVRRRTDWTLRTPLGAALFGVPGHIVGEIAAALTG